MGLDVGRLGAEELLGPFDGQIFDHIHKFAAAVIALAGVTLGIFIGEGGADGFHNRLADEILAGYELDFRALTVDLGLDGRGDLRVKSLYLVDIIHPVTSVNNY